MPELTHQDFVAEWKRVTLRAKQTYQEHFIDLCQLAGHHVSDEKNIGKVVGVEFRKREVNDGK